MFHEPFQAIATFLASPLGLPHYIDRHETTMKKSWNRNMGGCVRTR